MNAYVVVVNLAIAAYTVKPGQDSLILFYLMTLQSTN
jgi:hypothetical protein